MPCRTWLVCIARRSGGFRKPRSLLRARQPSSSNDPRIPLPLPLEDTKSTVRTDRSIRRERRHHAVKPRGSAGGGSADERSHVFQPRASCQETAPLFLANITPVVRPFLSTLKRSDGASDTHTHERRTYGRAGATFSERGHTRAYLISPVRCWSMARKASARPRPDLTG